jgi:hypothetical protein
VRLKTAWVCDERGEMRRGVSHNGPLRPTDPPEPLGVHQRCAGRLAPEDSDSDSET